MMKRGVRSLALLALLLTGGGCAQETATTSGDQTQQVSTIPWNRPEKWEGRGMLGGFQGSQ